MSRLQQTGLAALSGILLALAFPKVDWNILAWVAFVPLLWIIQGQTPRRAFTLGWISGMGFYLGTLYWIVHTIGLYSNIPYFIAVGLLLLMCAILSAYTGAFAAGLRIYAQHGLPIVLLGPLCWVALEWVRSFFFIGFPWVSLGYSQYNFLTLIQFVEFTGIYGLSALVVFGNIVLFSVLSRRGPGRGRLLLVLLLLVAGLSGWGGWRREQLAALPKTHTLRVGVAQGNIAQDKKWDPDYQETTLARYEQLTRRVAEQTVDLIVWPEASIPFFFQSDVTYRGRLLDLAQETKTPLLFGSPAFLRNGTDITLFNRAYLMSPETTILGQYDKIILAPFGEYIPFQSSILFFLDKWVEGIGDFAPGTTPTVFSLPFGEFGVLICYEGIFPDLARRFVHNGATLLINMTNDAWFGETSAPYQHLAMEAMRAVENRVPLVRAANTGISAIVGIDGQVQVQTALSEIAFLAEEIAWPQVTSVYTQYGDWFAKLCAVSVLVMLGYLYIKASFRRNGGNGYARRNEREIA